jgi:choline dehydrogenase
LIQANYLSESADVQVLVEAVKLARRRGHANAFPLSDRADAHPGPQVQRDEEIVEYIRDNVQSMFHPVGTCKMGHDTMAVVDDQLRVRGIDGLRVIDASIMPAIVSGNINAAVIVIAEKGADLVAHNV